MSSANRKKSNSMRMKARRYVMDLLFLHPGEALRLPSYADMARDLRMARSTLQLEMKVLIKEGYLETRAGIGTFTKPGSGFHFAAPLFGILEGDGRIVYEPYYSYALKSHIGMSLAKLPGVIQEIHLVSEQPGDQYEELRSTGCAALVCISPDPGLYPILRKLSAHMPVLTADREVPGLTSIRLNREMGGGFLGRELLKEGRTNPVFIKAEQHRNSIFKGTRAVFEEAGKCLPEKNFYLPGELDRFEEDLRNGLKPSAVIPGIETSDRVVALLRQYGVDLWKDCRFCTFMFPPAIEEPVMQFDFPFERFGELISKKVAACLTDPSIPQESIVFDYQFHRLGACGAENAPPVSGNRI